MKITVRSRSFGRDTVCFGKSDWRYADTNEPVEDRPSYPCKHCGLFQSADGHYPCIANLPWVKYGCCGHGDREGYVMFEDRRVLRGKFDHVVALSKGVSG